ncbi:MAG: hypothetical protein II779_13995, partial [Clostridia bacterium]|nr:hypothetical protein [Clostridia bacterium]
SWGTVLRESRLADLVRQQAGAFFALRVFSPARFPGSDPHEKIWYNSISYILRLCNIFGPGRAKFFYRQKKRRPIGRRKPFDQPAVIFTFWEGMRDLRSGS